jgi:hypothetical protein
MRMCSCMVPGACNACRTPTWARAKCKKCHGTGIKQKSGKYCKKCFEKSKNGYTKHDKKHKKHH